MDIGECGNDRPGFGVHTVSQKLCVNNYKRLLEFYGINISLIFPGYPARRCAAHFRIRIQWNGRLSPSLTGPRICLAIRCCSK
jgi:hypothetical protein